MNTYPVPLGHLTDTQLENLARDTDNELALEILRRHEEAGAIEGILLQLENAP